MDPAFAVLGAALVLAIAFYALQGFVVAFWHAARGRIRVIHSETGERSTMTPDDLASRLQSGEPWSLARDADHRARERACARKRRF